MLTKVRHFSVSFCKNQCYDAFCLTNVIFVHFRFATLNAVGDLLFQLVLKA